MLWGRKRKPQNPGVVGPPPDAASVPTGVDAMHIPIENAEPETPLDFASDWAALGDRAWEILQTRRMSDLWPAAGPCEFQRYLELLRRSSARYREEIFIGLLPPEYAPVFVPRSVFGNHAYILGGSGSGKTSQALAQLLIQLAEEYVDQRGTYHPPPPLLIMDLKQNGDRYLRALAEEVARQRQQKLQFFSNDPEYQSLHFDPLHSLRSAQYPIKMLETLLKALSMVYPEGYGSDFFTNEQRAELLGILYDDTPPKTLRQLVQRVQQATRKRGGNPDARGLYSALATLERAMHVHADEPVPDAAARVDFERFFEEREILYVHLDTRGLSLLSRDIGKLMLFALLETASQREKQKPKTQAFVFIDEFHRLAARNVVEMLEDARGAGLGFVLAHQSSASLQTRDADLYGILFENCSFKQCLTLEDPRVIDLFRTIAGRTTERSWGGSLAQAETSQAQTAWSQTDGPVGLLEWPRREAYTAGRRKGHDPDRAGLSGATRTSEGTTKTSTWQDALVGRLTPEMIQQVNDTNLLALVHIKGTGQNTLTPTGGAPTLVQGLYPFPHRRPPPEAGGQAAPEAGPYAEEMEHAAWPLKESLDPEEYYRKARPHIDRGVVAALSRRGTGRPQAGPAAAPPGPPPTADDQRVRRQLEQRILALTARLAGHMLPPAPSVEAFARQHAVGIAEVLAIAAELGLAVKTKEDRLTRRDVAGIKAQLRERRPQRKDNGPQAGPVV